MPDDACPPRTRYTRRSSRQVNLRDFPTSRIALAEQQVLAEFFSSSFSPLLPPYCIHVSQCSQCEHWNGLDGAKWHQQSEVMMEARRGKARQARPPPRLQQGSPLLVPHQGTPNFLVNSASLPPRHECKTSNSFGRFSGRPSLLAQLLEPSIPQQT